MEQEIERLKKVIQDAYQLAAWQRWPLVRSTLEREVRKQENPQGHDAELHDWAEWGKTLVGTIRNDSKGRFVNGTEVRTSIILGIEGDIAQTLNTRYKLVPAPKTKD